jgi:hypothetical protein
LVYDTTFRQIFSEADDVWCISKPLLDIFDRLGFLLLSVENEFILDDFLMFSQALA